MNILFAILIKWIKFVDDVDCCGIITDILFTILIKWIKFVDDVITKIDFLVVSSL
jgi:hypothetical protein